MKSRSAKIFAVLCAAWSGSFILLLTLSLIFDDACKFRDGIWGNVVQTVTCYQYFPFFAYTAPVVTLLALVGIYFNGKRSARWWHIGFIIAWIVEATALLLLLFSKTEFSENFFLTYLFMAPPPILFAIVSLFINGSRDRLWQNIVFSLTLFLAFCMLSLVMMVFFAVAGI